jgi:hypothetical protein
MSAQPFCIRTGAGFFIAQFEDGAQQWKRACAQPGGHPGRVAASVPWTLNMPSNVVLRAGHGTVVPGSAEVLP